MSSSTRHIVSHPTRPMLEVSSRWSLPLLALLATTLAGCRGTSSSQDEARAEANPASRTDDSSRTIRRGASGASSSDQPADETSGENTELREQVVDALSGYENLPSRPQLDELAPRDEMVPLLIDIYGDDRVEAFERQRVIGALRFYETDRVREWYENLLGDSETPRIDRRLAVRAYGAAFGSEAVPLLADHLSHSDYHTRKAAVATLADIDDPAADDALEKRLDEEPEKLIRQRIEEALASDE